MNQYNANGQRHGPWEFYHNKKIECKGQYVNGQKEGQWIWYYPNGTIAFNYVNGLMHGTFESHDDKSILVCKGQYVNGQKEGEWWETNITKAYTWLRTYSKDHIRFEKKYEYMGHLIHKAFFL